MAKRHFATSQRLVENSDIIKGAQALSEAEITARILQRAESYYLGYNRLRNKLVEGISEEADDDDQPE